MLEAFSMVSAYLSFAALHAASPKRLPAPWRAGVPSWVGPLLRALALILFASSVLAWRAVEPGPASWLVPVWTFLLSGTAIVLLRPIAGGWSLLLPACTAPLLFALWRLL